MFSLFKTADDIVAQIDDFLDAIDLGVLVFKEGVNNYLSDDQENFLVNIAHVRKLEGKADAIRRHVENQLYTHSLLPEYRSDLLQLLEKLDDVIDTANENLSQYEVETPIIPEELVKDYQKLAEVSVEAAAQLVVATRAFFRNPKEVKDRVHRVYFYEKEADRIAHKIKWKVYKEMDGLLLSEKMQLSNFTGYIENISDIAESVADILSIIAIKRTV